MTENRPISTSKQGEKQGEGNDGRSSQELAEERTDWAEDRTLMANERTFAGWMRTGLAACGIGLGFHAIFGKTEPTWLAKSGATLFIAISLAIFVAAFRASRRVHERLDSHATEPVERGALGWIAGLLGVGACTLAIVLWLL